MVVRLELFGLEPFYVDVADIVALRGRPSVVELTAPLNRGQRIVRPLFKVKNNFEKTFSNIGTTN